jgi:ABC-2 type transport system ATP-binding protein
MNENIEIRVNDLSRYFGKIKALDEVSLTFSKGQMHGLIGPEGAGKTTLLRIIVGLLKANGGTVSYYSNDVVTSLSAVRETIGYMPQQQSLYPDLSIDEHLDFFRDLYDLPESVYKARRSELLHITRLEKFIERPAKKLSGGMYKKLGLACALLQSPTVLLLDEPTNGVDPISRREFWDLLYRLKEQNILIIITTAYMDEAERCSEVHLLESGKLIGTGEPKEVLKKAGVESFDEFFRKKTGGV